MRTSPLRHARTTLALAVLLGAVAVLGGRQATPVGAVTMQSDFAGLVDIGGGRRLYLECRGQGSPTVVLVSGYGDTGHVWSLDLPEFPQPPVLPAVAGFTRVCAYDRPGTIGIDLDDPALRSRSDPVPQPRAAEDTVADLHALLRAAQVPGPYVLAGHSLGGLFVRLYAATYPDEVVGLVLVDATNEYVRAALTPEAWAALAALSGAPPPGVVDYPEVELFDFNAASDAVERAASSRPLHQLPLVVLARGREDEPPPELLAVLPPGFFDAMAVAWRASQTRLAALVPAARRVIAAESGHYIQVEQPALVIEAIRQVVAGVRHPDTWYDLVSCCGAATSTATTAPGPTARASGLKAIDPAALQAMVDTAAREMLVPGAIVLLRTPQGEVIVSSGTTELGATIPPRADTYFRIASNTKTMTAAVILQLAQENKLNLSDSVSKYVPGVPNGEIITIAELLEMRSGLFNFITAPEFATALDRDPTKAWTRAEVLAIAFARPPNFAPGTEYEYSNTNYELLGQIAEQVDGRPLARAMQERLFGPLGLQHTLLPARTVNAIPEPYAHGYMYGSAVHFLTDEPYSPEVQAAARAGTLLPNDYTNLNHSWGEATGGAISTAGDLATWIEALVGGRVLDAAYQRRWLDSPQPEDPTKPDGQRYGYGIAQLRWASNTVYFHGGETGGYNSKIGYDPINQMTLVVWTNLTLSPDGQQPANTLMVKVLDQIYAVSPLAPSSPSETR